MQSGHWCTIGTVQWPESPSRTLNRRWMGFEDGFSSQAKIMIKLAFIPIAWVLAGIGAIPGAAMAQVASSSSYTSFGVAQGAIVQLGYYASANNNCTPARPPTIRVIEKPRSGVLTVRPGELTTDRIAGCLSVKTPAQIVSYEARSDDTDTDHLIY